jgi:nucleotide-binding universal stress UspA family protein
MSGILFPALVLVTWVAIGLASVLFLERHGRRSVAWFAIGAVLGPILLPIAVELAASQGTLLERRPQREVGRARMTALVAVDGSAESDDALSDAADMLAPKGARFILLTVLDPDVGETDPSARQTAEALLAERAEHLPGTSLPPVREVAAGDPARVILQRASADAVDVIVLGRRGRGVAQALLGSVADQVVRRSPRPVLLGRAPARHG